MKYTFCKVQLFEGPTDTYKNLLQAALLCQLHQTYNIIILDQKYYFLFTKTYFKAVFTSKALKFYMLS